MSQATNFFFAFYRGGSGRVIPNKSEKIELFSLMHVKYFFEKSLQIIYITPYPYVLRFKPLATFLKIFFKRPIQTSSIVRLQPKN